MLDKLPIELLCSIIKFIDADRDFINFCLTCKKTMNISRERFITKLVCRYDKSKFFKRFNFESIKLYTHEYFEIPNCVTEIKFNLDKLLYLRTFVHDAHKSLYIYKEFQKYIDCEHITKIIIFDTEIVVTIIDDAKTFSYGDIFRNFNVDFTSLLIRLINYKVLICYYCGIVLDELDKPELPYCEINTFNNAVKNKKYYDKKFNKFKSIKSRKYYDHSRI